MEDSGHIAAKHDTLWQLEVLEMMGDMELSPSLVDIVLETGLTCVPLDLLSISLSPHP